MPSPPSLACSVPPSSSSPRSRRRWPPSQVKAANASCATFFYLNSQIDFPELQLHDQFAANGAAAAAAVVCPPMRRALAGIFLRSPAVCVMHVCMCHAAVPLTNGARMDRQRPRAGSWWLRNSTGGFVMHKNDKIFDLRVTAARNAWLAVAQVR
jgi:hypothetical protein